MCFCSSDLQQNTNSSFLQILWCFLRYTDGYIHIYTVLFPSSFYMDSSGMVPFRSISNCTFFPVLAVTANFAVNLRVSRVFAWFEFFLLTNNTDNGVRWYILVIWWYLNGFLKEIILIEYIIRLRSDEPFWVSYVYVTRNCLKGYSY